MGKFIHKTGNHNLFLEIQRKKFTVIYFLLKNFRVQIFSKNKSIFLLFTCVPWLFSNGLLAIFFVIFRDFQKLKSAKVFDYSIIQLDISDEGACKLLQLYHKVYLNHNIQYFFSFNNTYLFLFSFLGWSNFQQKHDDIWRGNFYILLFYNFVSSVKFISILISF